MSWGAQAVEAPFGVDAGATATQSRRLFALVYVHANLHNVMAAIARIAIALEIAGRVPACAITAHLTRDLALVDVVALYTMLVERKALIALATVAADRVFASTVQTHAREFDALIDILTFSEAVSTGAQFGVSLRAYFRTQLAFVAAPAAAYGTAAEALGEMTLYGTGALTVTMVQVAQFLPGIDTGGVRRV